MVVEDDGDDSNGTVEDDCDVGGGTVEDDGDDEVEDCESGQTSLCCSAQVTFVSSCKSLAAFQCFFMITTGLDGQTLRTFHLF